LTTTAPLGLTILQLFNTTLQNSSSDATINNSHENQEISKLLIKKAKTMSKHFVEVKERLPNKSLSSSISIKHELTSRQFACPLCKGTLSKYKHKRKGGAFKVTSALR
jgi:hypothetical protein